MARQPGRDVFVDSQLIRKSHFLERARDAASRPPVRRQPPDIAILKADIERTLVLLGCPSIRDLNGSWIELPKSW